MSKKEIKEDIKYIKKNVILKFKYYLHLFLYYGIVLISFLLLIFYLYEYNHLSMVFNIIISLMYLFFMIFLNISYLRGGFKNICQEESTAKIIHSITLSHKDDLIWDLNYRHIWLINYRYKKKMYTRIIEVWDNDDMHVIRKKINIRICKYFPKLIYIEKLHRDKTN